MSGPAQQTSVDFKPVGFAGELSDTMTHDLKSYISEQDDMGTGLEVPFGTMMIQGSADNGALPPSAQSPDFLGVVTHSNSYAKSTELGDNGLKLGTTLKLLRRGRIWVYVPGAVDPGDAVHVRIDDNSGDQGDPLLGPGTFSGTADTVHTVTLTEGARWMTSTGGAGMVELELDMAALATSNDS